MEFDSTGKVVIGADSKVHTLVVPEGVHTIGEGAFRGCFGLTSLTLPHSLTSIQDYALAHCDGLTSLTLPDTCTSIGQYAFAVCTKLTSLTLPASLTSVGKSALVGCIGLTSLSLPKTLKSVDSWAFARCRLLTSVTLPHELTHVGFGAFECCIALTSVTFRPRVSAEFIVWAVSSSRNRRNWQTTTVKYLRNVLRLVTVLCLERRDVRSVDPDGKKGVFVGCDALNARYALGGDSKSNKEKM